MGNQSTSGIVEEEKATNEAAEKAQEVSSPDELKEENQTLIQEDETKDFQEKGAEADSHDAKADNSPPVERLTSDEREVSEEHKGSVNEDCVTPTATLPNVPSDRVEPKESNLAEGRFEFNNEEQDQPCTLKGEMQNPNPKCTSTITNLNSTPHEAVNITSEPQDDQNMLGKEIVETLGLIDSFQIEAERCLVDTKVVQNSGVTATLDIDDHDVEKNEDDLVMADMASVEGALLETCAHKEELGRGDDPPQEEQSNSFNTLNDVPSISLLDLSAAENEKQQECLAQAEEKLMMNELGNGDTDNTIYVDQTQPPDQEIKQFLSCSNAPPEMIKSDFKENGEKYAVESKVDLLDEVKALDERDEIGWSNFLKSIPSEEPKDPNELKDIGSIQMEGTTIAVAENQENDNSTGESILEKAVLRESEPSAIENDHESETGTIEKCILQPRSSLEIKRVTKFETAQDAQPLSSITAEAETQPSLSDAQYSDSETPILEDSDSEAHASTEMLDFESNPSSIGVQVELRKSPSFDFGLSFDARSEESDQTPLLYQDRTAMRSFSSCSNLRFQNRSVQTEYLGKSLQYEAVEVEEKTIRMERSNSESSRAPPLNLLNKEVKANVDTKAKQENSASDKKHDNGLKASPSRDDGATISPKENGKRKPRSSLFTTCMCCTAAIS